MQLHWQKTNYITNKKWSVLISRMPSEEDGCAGGWGFGLFRTSLRQCVLFFWGGRFVQKKCKTNLWIATLTTKTNLYRKRDIKNLHPEQKLKKNVDPFRVSGTASGGTWRFRKVKKNSMLPKQKTLNNSLGKKVMVPFFLQRSISFATHVPFDFFLFPPISASLLFFRFIVHWEKTKQRKMSVWGAKLPTVSYFFVSLGLVVKELFYFHKTFLRQHFDLYRRFPTPRVTFPKRYRSQRIFFSSYHVFFRIGISLSFFSQYHKVKQWVGIMSAPRAQEDFWRRPKTDQGRKTECLGTRGSHKMPKKFPFNQ